MQIFTKKCLKLLNTLFPDNGKYCACGCGLQLTGRRTRYAKDECSKYVTAVFHIISGNVDVLRFYRAKYLGVPVTKPYCEECLEEFPLSALELDHIIGVKHGGGGGWLSNYRFLCKSCHRTKTNQDFGFSSRSKK